MFCSKLRSFCLVCVACLVVPTHGWRDRFRRRRTSRGSNPLACQAELHPDCAQVPLICQAVSRFQGCSGTGKILPGFTPNCRKTSAWSGVGWAMIVKGWFGWPGRVQLLWDLYSVCRKTPFLEFEPASAVKFDPDLTGGFRVKWTWSATFGGKRRAGGDFGAHIGDFWKYRAWRAAGSPVRAALARFPGDVRQLFVAGT